MTSAPRPAPTSIVFDMDGVLADTERLKLRAHREAVEAAGGALTRDLYRKWMGDDHRTVVRAFLEASELATDGAAVERYEVRFRRAYRALLEDELAPTPGALELLAACREEDRRLALVTSSERWMAERVLERLGIAGAFRAVVTADDVEREKPHPEPYLAARAALGNGGPPGPGPASGGSEGRERRGGRRPVAVEDTRSGAASAVAAGLPVIAVRHDLNRDHDFEEAATVMESLTPPERFLEVVEEVAGG